MRENTRTLITELKDTEQDYEFYPTTNEIISALVQDIKCYKEDYYNHRNNCTSILDIGAGNGKVLLALHDADIGLHELHAIEKSTLLCQELPHDVLIVGTEFYEQSLLTKAVDIIFCNPPYSEFENWAEKIIRESAAPVAYLVIPQRWQGSVSIADALRFREAKAEVIGEFDFENAEERQARAKVHLLRVNFDTLAKGYRRKPADEAFERFFNEQFGGLKAKFEEAKNLPSQDGDKHNRGDDHPFKKLVVGKNYPEALVSLYVQEMEKTQHNYNVAGELDVSLLKEFDISLERIMGCLKARLSGLKNSYWHELFSRLSSVTDRLTSQSRQNLLEMLHKHVEVDFTLSNIYAVLIWVIKNANLYMESQVVDLYEQMVDKCNVHMYKSNQRTWLDDGWRYNSCATDNSHYALDYRIVTHRVGGMRSKWGGKYELVDRAAIFLGDLLTIANNLGFHCSTSDSRLHWHNHEGWESGKSRSFTFRNAKGEHEILFEVKAFKNGNLHLRLNQKFILALNVEYGRLKGWLRSPQEAADELNDLTAADHFKSNHQLCSGSPALLLTAA